MKIRTQFIINIVVLGSILLFVSVAVVVTNQWVENTHGQQELAAQIEREAYELGYLANDYLLHRESQQASRWESKFASFSDHLSNLQVDTPEQQALLTSIKSNQQRLKAVFEEVKASIEAPPQTQGTRFDEKFMQLSWSRMEVQNQGMIFDASRLEGLLSEQEHSLERLARLLSFALIGMLAVFLLMNYGLSFRRILQAIANLQSGTRIIGSGNLDFAIDVKSDDEIGELSHAFNRMTGQLRTITASRGELEREIADRKWAQEALRKSEQKFSVIFEKSAFAGSLSRLPNGVIVNVNEEFERVFGYTKEEVIGRTSLELGINPDSEGRARLTAELQARGSVRNQELTLVTKSGLRRVFLLNIDLVEIGEEKYILQTAQDITERKQAEEALHESEQRLKRAQVIAHLGSWELDLVKNQLTWSDEVYRIFGLQPQEFGATYEAFLAAVHPDDRAAVDAAYSGSIQAGRDSYEIEHRVVRRSTGEIRIVHEKCEHFRDQFGQIIRSIGMVHDITERKRAEVEIASLAKFPTENPNPILRVQTDGRLTYANAASQELLDKWECEVNDYLPEELRDFITVAVDDHLNKTVDVPCNDKVYSIMLVPVMESGYVNIYGRDITERRHAEEELKQTLEELKHSNTELEQFAYVASHDLQEPLRMVSSYMQLLKRRYQGKLDSDADQFIAFAVDGATRMQNLINDLLAFSRVGTRGRPMGLSSSEKVFAEALLNLQVAIEESNAIITHDPLPTVFCDQPQLVQVFQNLIGNSIKFRGQEAPQIHVSAKCEENEWIFSICDNGIGLDAKFGERIFEIFQRLHSRTAYPGTGIGLAISKRIIQRHHGRIWVESTPGAGATFYFTLPVKETS